MSDTSLTEAERKGAAAAMAVALKYFVPTRTGRQTLWAMDILKGLS